MAGDSQLLQQMVPASRAFAITPSDSVNFANVTRALYVGGAGNVVGVMQDGTVVTFSGMTAGTVYALRLKRINATLTTATGLVGLY
ncbi:MAG TPA: hypothetical protein VF041_23040 [Gemmatimonadaceae bacterium]